MTASKPGSGDNKMSQALKPYSSYKPSGRPWLGDIPEHWDVRRNGRLFRQRNETGFPDLPILEVSLKTGVRVRDFENSKRKQVMGDKGKYKRAAAGDIAYNMMRMWQGAVGVAPEDGLISPAYVVAEPFPETDTHYFSYLFRTDAYKNEVNKYSHGIVSDRNRLYWDEFKQIPTPFPPAEEQEAIAGFLNFKSSQIAKFIQAKRKLIALLNEQKQAIINQAVTRGLDPNVRLKPSGVDYLGDIPEHWDVLKLKRIVGFNPSKQESAQYLQRNDSVVFLPMEKVSAEGVIDCSEVRPAAELWSGFTYFRKNDVVVAKITPCFENGKGACLDNLETPIGFGTTEFIVMRPGNRILPKYLYYITRFSRFRILGEEAMTGAAGQQRVPTDFMKDFLCGLPEKPEQAQIVEQIENELSKVEHLIERAKTEIDLIREYRTRLISDVVTGKLDVRGIEVEDVDAIEILDGLDDADDDALLDQAEENLNEDD